MVAQFPQRNDMTVTLHLDDASKDPSQRRLLTDLSLAVVKCRRIVVVTGAGISCSCGIPVSSTSLLRAPHLIYLIFNS